MAVNNFSGLTINNPQVGIQITKVTDSSSDWTSVSSSTYFYDKGDRLVHYKDATGNIVDLFSTSASYAATASYLAGTVTSASYSQTASYVNPLQQDVILTGSLNVSGSTLQVGNNTLLGNTILSGSIGISGSSTIQGTTTMTGSLLITGSTTQVGNNTLLGDTLLTGSITISGSFPIGSLSSSVNIYGDTTMTGFLKFNPYSTNIDTSISASYIFVSGSTNDLYFAQNASGYSNVTRLRWIEGNLYSGLLHGGIITSQSSTVYQVQSGSGIIVSLNSSVSDDPYPTVQYVNWPTLSSSIAPLSASFDQTFVAIQSNNTLYIQGTPFYDGQLDTLIPIGIVIHPNRSTINGVKTQPELAYGWKQRSNIFIEAFGPLKLSGHLLSVSGSSTGSIIVTSGTSFADGANYEQDPNNPSYIIDAGTTVSKIFRYRQSGSSWVYDTNGGAGYPTIDPSKYSLNGTLTAVPTNDFTIQRVFWYPNSVSKALIVYYGNAHYDTLAEAIVNINIESFIEAPNTATNAIYIGALILRHDAEFTVPTTYNIIPAGLFRQVGGSGGGGSVVTQTLSGLSDVTIAGPTNGQPLVYNTVLAKWQNQSTLTATLTGNASTATTASYANTASYLNTLNQDLTFNGNLTLNGTASITYLNTIYETASVIYSSGSNQFGDATNDTQTLIGRTILSGSLQLTGSANLPSITGSLFGTSSWANNAQTASYVNPLRQDVIITGSLVVSASGTTNDFQVGANKLFVSASGNVGIGTTTPLAPLQVLVSAVPSSGEEIVRFSVSDDTNSFLRIYNSTNTNATYIPTLEGKNSTNSVALITIGNGTTDTGTNPLTVFDSRIGSLSATTRPLFQWRNFGTSQMTMIANGDLGIGTTTPTHKLHVYNTDANTVLIERSSSFNAHIQYKNISGSMWAGISNSGNFSIGNQVDLSTSGLFTIVSASGNVGIGTTTPQNKLHVLGNADAIALEGIDHVYQEYFPQGISAGRFGYTGYSSSGSADFRIYNEAGDGRILLGTSGSTLDARMSILGNGNVGVGITLASEINAKLHITNTSTSASFLVEDSTNPDSTPFIINNAGLVGIGTTSPSTSLHIVSPAGAGAENIQRWQISDSDAYIQLQNGTTAPATFIPALISNQATSSNASAIAFVSGIGDDTGTNPALVFQARSGSAAAILNRPLFRWSNYTNHLMWLDATGSLSIGVENAATKLHVQGDTGLRVGRTAGGDTQYIDINHNISGVGVPAITSFSPTTNAKTLIINATTNALSTPASAGNVGIALLTYGTGSLWVDSKQFVGVGIAAPTAKLHVTNTSPSASFLVEDATNPDATPFVIDASGNVGIGTLSPISELTVSASGVDGILLGTNTSAGLSEQSGRLMFGSITASNTVTMYAASGGLNIATGGTPNVSSGTTRMYISSSGNVGIGTGTPTLGTLQVNGNVHATSFTGSLFGTASWASNAISASFVNTLNQNVIITGSVAIGTSSIGPNENTLTLGPRDAAGEGGQLGLNASGGTYTSASMIDVYQNRLRILRGTNAGSDAEFVNVSLHTGQVSFSKYTGSGAFPGTAVANLAVDSGGNIIIANTGYTKATVTISAATITGSMSSGAPVQLLPAPAAGKYYEWHGFIRYNYGGVAYNNGGTGQYYIEQGGVDLGDGFNLNALTKNLTWKVFEGSGGQILGFEFNSGSSADWYTSSLNLRIGGATTSGNGTITASMYYRELPL